MYDGKQAELSSSEKPTREVPKIFQRRSEPLDFSASSQELGIREEGNVVGA